MGWLRGQVLQAAANDIAVTERLMRITNLIDPPDRLRDPALLGRALVSNLRRQPFWVKPSVPGLSHAR